MSSKPTVAVIGASTDPTKYSARSLRAHAECGYEVFPVNPTADTVDGWTAYASITDIPGGPLDRVTMYVPPTVGVTLLPAIAEKGCRELWLNPGAESDEMVDRARELGLDPIQACSLVDCQAKRRANERSGA